MNASCRLPLLGLLALLLAPLPASAETCAVCRRPIFGVRYQLKSSAYPDPLTTCKPCTQIKTRCSTCRIPVRDDGKVLEDGRLLCRDHAAAGIFSGKEVRRLFETAKGEVFPILDGLGTLPSRNITVHVADAKFMSRLRREIGPAPAGYDTMGLTHSRRSPEGEWTHRIFFLSGLDESMLLATMAHEYAHVWLNENLPENRKVQVDTVEGFCELVAFQVMKRRRNPGQQKVILQNSYTKGQVEVLLQAREQHQFHRVADWMLHGTSPTLDPEDQQQILQVRKPKRPPRGGSWNASPVATPVPDTLTLKGISGRPGRRFALVNNQTLEADQTARVRVGSETVQVRCLGITANSVTLQVLGRSEPVTLRLRPGS